MIKLLAVDMDGTCLDSHNRLPQKVLEALTAAQEAGILVAVSYTHLTLPTIA